MIEDITSNVRTPLAFLNAFSFRRSFLVNLYFKNPAQISDFFLCQIAETIGGNIKYREMEEEKEKSEGKKEKKIEGIRTIERTRG